MILDSVKSKMSKFASNNTFIKSVISIGISILMFIPTYIGIGAWFLISPDTFWEKLATLALLVIVLGSVQLWLLIIGIAAIVTIVFENYA